MSEFPSESESLPAVVVSDPMDILGVAVARGASIDTIERLVALKFDLDARRAASEFNVAMASFVKECPSIQKTSTVKIATKAGGEYGYKFADLDQIATTIRPFLGRFGLSYSFDSEVTEKALVCTCTVRHIGGHSQSAKFTCPTETTSTGMSPQQRYSSALKFAMRQALTQVLALSTCDPEADRTAISPAEADELELALTAKKADRAKFLKYMGADTVNGILARDLVKARSALK